MEKIKCKCCGRTLSIEQFWKYKAPNKEWENHSSLEKPYHTCRNCCNYQLQYLNKDFQEILKELDIPYIKEEWEQLQKEHPQDKNWGRYITKMKLQRFYGFGYNDTEYLNKKYDKNKIKIVAFVGKSGSGKDHLMRDLVKHMNWHIIVPSTTRPKRDYETEGVDYHFLTEQEFVADDFIETTVFNDWFYGTRFQDLSPDKTNIGVYSPAAVRKLAADERIELSIFHVKASAKTRLLRQLNREKDPDVKEIIRRFGADEADFADADKELPQLASKYYYYYWNDEAVGQE